MRYLSYGVLGFAGALALCAYYLGAFPLGALGAAFLFLGFFFTVRHRDAGKRAMLILLGAALGFSLFDFYSVRVLEPLKAHDGEIFQGEVLLKEAPVEGKFGARAEGEILLEGKYRGVTVFLPESMDLHAGDRAAGSFRLEWPQDRKYQKTGEGIFFSAFPQGDLAYSKTEDPSWRFWPGRLREFAQDLIFWCFPQDTAPFARALLLGDTEDLDFKTQWDLRVSGIRHLVAVSGLHVTILCLLLSFLTFQNRWLNVLLGIPVLLLFGAVTGFSPSVQRAMLMMILLMLARVLDRRYDPITELSTAVFLMLLHNPMTITSVGFQLSVCSVLGILLFYGKLRLFLLTHLGRRKGWRKKAAGFLADSLAVSLSSLVFVTPLCGFYFGSVSLIAPLTNLLVVFLTPFLFGGILLTVILGSFSLGAASILGTAVSFGIRYVLAVSHGLSRMPLASVYLNSPSMVIWLISVYILGIFLLLGRKKRVVLFLETVLCGLVLSLAVSWFLPGGTAVTVFDVGQGQCVLLSSQGRNYLVDCGGDRETWVAEQAAKHLLSKGVTRLDGLILTHFDRDHVCAADELLSVIPAEQVYLPLTKDLPKGEAIHPVEKREKIPFSSTSLWIYPGQSGEITNETGLCVLLDSRDYDILITGDRSFAGEEALLKEWRLPKVDCLVAGHHGAKDSTGFDLLEAVKPDTVVISAGRKNRYGHPAEETLARLRYYGCEIRRTDLEGTITLRR